MLEEIDEEVVVLNWVSKLDDEIEPDEEDPIEILFDEDEFYE